MEKDLKGYQLIELLDIKSLLPDYSDKEDEDKEAKEVRYDAIAKIYDAIAKKLFNEYHIKKGDCTYDFLEIEFYYFDKGFFRKVQRIICHMQKSYYTFFCLVNSQFCKL